MTHQILTTEQQVRLGSVIEEAADDIVDFGWATAPNYGGFPHDPNGDYLRCVWIAAIRAMERNNVIGFNDQNAVEDAILAAAEVANLNALFDLNDSQTEEEGQAWAYGVLTTASHILNPALVDGDRKTDLSLTGKTDTGSTRNVVSRLISFLKKFIWVR